MCAMTKRTKTAGRDNSFAARARWARVVAARVAFEANPTSENAVELAQARIAWDAL